MKSNSKKRVANVSLPLNKRNVEALKPTAKPWIAWDDKLIGFGVRIQPTGLKSFLINYRDGSGGRKSRNRRVVIGRYGTITPAQARRLAREMLGNVAGGGDPASERAQSRGIPTLRQAFDEYMDSKTSISNNSAEMHRYNVDRYLGDWLSRQLSSITRKEVEARFNSLTKVQGWATANQTISLLRSVFRRSCVDHEGLRNPVDLWLSAGGKYNRTVRRKITAPGETLPRWHKGIWAAVRQPATRDIFWVGQYTGMRLGEILALRWEQIDLRQRVLCVEETKSGQPLELPLTRQLESILKRRQLEMQHAPEDLRVWVFPSRTSASGHIEILSHLYGPIGESAGCKFWFHGLRNCFISVAERELMLPRSLTKRLVNHARPSDVTEGYAADWTVEQLRVPAQRIADRIDQLVDVGRGSDLLDGEPPM